MTAPAAGRFVKRELPSRPFRLGTRRRRAPQGRAVPQPGVSRAAGAPSLDTWKQLARSDFDLAKTGGKKPARPDDDPMTAREWLLAQKTEGELAQEAEWLHAQLLGTVRKIMQRWANTERDADSLAWLADYRAVQERREGESGPDAYKRLKAWLKENKPRGSVAEWLKWERAYFAIGNCGKEYIGWAASCCPDRTKPIAVPVGCNHRLCPRCSYRRSMLARTRIKTMFDRLTHPAMFTLTVPNLPTISKHDFKMFRYAARKWISQRTVNDMDCQCGCGRDAHKQPNPATGKLARNVMGCRNCGSECMQWRPVPCDGRGGAPRSAGIQHEFMGGIYSMETTHNRRSKTWHIHAHVLGDLNYKLPPKVIDEGGKTRLNRVEFYGRHVLAFTAMKWRMEFDWLQLTGGREEWGCRPKNDPPKKSLKAQRKWAKAWNEYFANFQRWVLEKRDHSTIDFKVKRGRKWFPRQDLSPAEMAEYKRREGWNAKNTRVFHVEPVDNREGAAYEVLKYITKVADFSDRPEAVEEFANAARGARMVQTFGTWFGFTPQVVFDPNHMDDWSQRPSCACGSNHWERKGVYNYGDVETDETGRLYLKESVLKHDLGGTVARPRIRGSDPQKEPTDARYEWSSPEWKQ